METSNLPLSILQPFQSLSVSATTTIFDQNFATNKTHEEIAAAINHNLQLHTGSNIDKFHLYFGPPAKFLPDIENWVAHAARKGVKEISLDFSMGFDNSNEESINEVNLPTSLFRCDTLTTLSLSHCNFLPPAGFVGFQNLQSVSLTRVNITKDILQQFISNCSLLDSLRIACCTFLERPIIVSSWNLRKLILENASGETYVMEISAPKLESFIYHGTICFADVVFFECDSFIHFSSLSDVFIFGTSEYCPEYDFNLVLYDLRHITVLSVCAYTCWFWDEYEKSPLSPDLPILLENLKELQLLVGFMSEDLEGIYGFFRACASPFVEKLFIQLSGYNGDLEERKLRLDREVEDPSNANFDHLKVIMVRNFLGCRGGMRLVSFLLQKAVNLESLVIIAHPKFSEQSMDTEQGGLAPDTTESMRITDLMSLHAQLSLLPKASPLASIVPCEHSEFGMYWTPTHTEYFDLTRLQMEKP